MEKQIRELFNTNILKQAAEFFGSTLDEVREVGGFENFIYAYQKDGEDYILRISHSHHRNFKEIESELDFVNFLSKRGAHVSGPVLSIHGNLVEIVNCENGSYFTITSYIKAKGSHVKKETATELFFENYGITIGQMHRLAKSYQPSNGITKRYEWFDDLIITEAKDYLPKHEQEIYKKLQELVQFIKTLPKNQDNYGLIHTDMHMGNFFVDHDELTVFDFDDCAYQHFISDIAVALFYYVAFVKDEETRLKMADEFMTRFMKGYQQEFQLDINSFHQFNHFLKLRELILYVVVYRSCDLETNEWAKNYISMFRDRILKDQPLLNLNFSQYLKK